MIEHCRRGLGWGAAGLLLVAAGLSAGEVVVRSLAGVQLVLPMEMAQLCLIWAVPLGLVPVFGARRFPAAELLPDPVGERPRAVAAMLADIVVLLVALVLTWQGGLLCREAMQSGGQLSRSGGLPTWLADLAIPVGGGLLAIGALVELGLVMVRRARPSSGAQG